MITLSNGDKWIIDDSEWKDQGISYEEACKGNIPKTDIRDFVNRLCVYYSCEDNESDDGFLTPRKLTGERLDLGYWDCNFDVFANVLGSVATYIITNPWSNVYFVPWGEVIVVFQRSDGGCSVETVVKVYNNYGDYIKKVVRVVGG